MEPFHMRQDAIEIDFTKESYALGRILEHVPSGSWLQIGKRVEGGRVYLTGHVHVPRIGPIVTTEPDGAWLLEGGIEMDALARNLIGNLWTRMRIPE